MARTDMEHRAEVNGLRGHHMREEVGRITGVRRAYFCGQIELVGVAGGDVPLCLIEELGVLFRRERDGKIGEAGFVSRLL